MTPPFESIAAAIAAHSSFLLVAHVGPDGDAIGSGLALRMALDCEHSAPEKALSILKLAAEEGRMRELWVWLAELEERCGRDSTASWRNARELTNPTTGYMNRADCWDNSKPQLAGAST